MSLLFLYSKGDNNLDHINNTKVLVADYGVAVAFFVIVMGLGIAIVLSTSKQRKIDREFEREEREKDREWSREIEKLRTSQENYRYQTHVELTRESSTQIGKNNESLDHLCEKLHDVESQLDDIVSSVQTLQGYHYELKDSVGHVSEDRAAIQLMLKEIHDKIERIEDVRQTLKKIEESMNCMRKLIEDTNERGKNV